MRRIILLFIIITLYSPITFSFNMEEINNKVKEQYWSNTLDLVNDKVWTKINEINIIRKSPWEWDDFIVWETKEIYNNQKQVNLEEIERNEYSNEWTIWEYDNTSSNDLPIIFKPLSEDLIKKRVENNFKEHLLNILMLEYENQRRKIPKYTWYDLIQLSSITAPWVMWYKKPNKSSATTENNSLSSWGSSWQCPVWQEKNKFWICIISPNRTNNNYSNIDVCKNWQKLVNWVCVVVDKNLANSIYKENKIKDWITTIWVVVEKPNNTYGDLFIPKSNNMSINPVLLKKPNNTELLPTSKYCEWWVTSVNWEIICPNSYLNFLKDYK